MTPETTYWRQLGILHPNELKDIKVTLIGAGGIGSPTALCLAKMGIPSLTVYDPDTIEEHNLPNQLYPMNTWLHYPENIVSTIGWQKAEVLARVVNNEFVGWEYDGDDKAIVKPVPEKYESQPLSGIVISGVDSMKSRQTIWAGVQESKWDVDLYIEARMGAEVGMIYSINPKDPEQATWYETHMLYDDLEAIEAPCTERSIIYNVFVLAGLIARQVKNYIKGQDVPKEVVMDLVNLSIMRSSDAT